MKRKALALGIILLFIGTAIIPSSGQKIEKSSTTTSRGNWLYVGGSGPGNYTKIQDAIDNTSAGDTVFVFPGDYIEKVEIRKSITLRGGNKNTTFIRYSGNSLLDYIVLIAADNIVFSDFTVMLINGTCPAVELNRANNCFIANNIVNSSWGIRLDNANRNSIVNNSVFTINAGIIIGNSVNVSSRNIIKNNRITNKGNPELIYNNGISLWEYAENNIIFENYFYDCYNYAIYSQSPYNNTIEMNVIRQNHSKSDDVGIGIFDAYSRPGNTIRQNDISRCVTGIATAGDYFTISDNIVHDNQNGIYLAGGHYLFTIVTNNTFINNSYGLDMVYALFDKVERNTFHGNTYALFLEECNGLRVRFNNFTANTWAVVPTGSSLNVFYRNNFMGNHHYVLSALSWNIWLLNYWDQPRLFPKLIVGFLPFIQFDWRPALQPN